MKISGFSSLFSAIAVFLDPPTNVRKNTAIAEKREAEPEILTDLVRKVNKVLRSYLSPSVFTVRSGPVWPQDLAILSPEGPRDNTCQLRSGA